MTRTIIDILQRGNLELFHSSMLAWLLDGKGEHGMGMCVLARLADILTRKGWPQLKNALAGGTRGGRVVRTEVKRGRNRYDIWLKLPNTEVIFENKTKTIGNESQLKSFQQGGAIVVAVGFCDESFANTVANQYPLLTYEDVLEAIKAVAGNGVTTGAFGTLAAEYIRYLERELEIIKLVRNLILCPQGINRQSLAKKVGSSLYGENDRRFWNLIVLEQCRRILSQQMMWVNTEWTMDKNQPSGVWLAGIPDGFVFSGPLQQCAKKFSASLWFHVELFHEALMNPDDDKEVGMLQLRCEVKKNKVFAQEFQRQYKAGNNSIFATGINPNWQTFYVIKRHLQGQDLPGRGITKALNEFVQTFQ